MLTRNLTVTTKIMNIEPEIIENLTCPCGASFEYKSTIDQYFPENLHAMLRPDHCPTCQAEIERMEEAKKAESAKQERIAAIRAQVDRATPQRFLNTDVAHPSFNRKAWGKISAWRPTEERPWLGIIGPSGLCKTRMAYMVAKEILIELEQRHADFVFIGATDLRQTILNGYSSDDETKAESVELLDRAMKCDLLFIDDLGKGKFSPAVAEGFFRILNHRHDYNLCTIWTANSSPQQIASMLPDILVEDMSGPFVGRLVECSSIYNLRQ